MALKTALFFVALAVIYGLYQQRTAKPVPSVQGSCTAAFKGVEETYRDGFANGREKGSSLAIYHKGELVCDMWGGWADESRNLAWSNETLSIVFSTTKGVSAIAFALLHERGLFQYEELVSKHWPEFAQNGKEKVTIAQLLSHQAGLAALDEDLSLEDVRERPEVISKAIEKQKPNWTPGTAHGYHALTFALNVDQMIRRIDSHHRGLDQFFREEIAEPYDIEFDIGLPYSKQWRSTLLVLPSGISGMIQMLTNIPYLKFAWSIKDKTEAIRSFSNPKLDPVEYNWPTTRATPLGSALGSGNARGVAKLYSIVVAPQHHKKAILSEETMKTLITPQTGTRRERFFELPAQIGMGVWIHKGYGDLMTFHHPGYGGQIGAAIPEKSIGWSYITNYLGFYIDSFEDHRVQPLYKALVEAVNKL